MSPAESASAPVVDLRLPPADHCQQDWYRYAAIARKQDRETDRRSYEDGWREGFRYSFRTSSALAPAIDLLVQWLAYVTDYPEPPA